jgi:hypothetical protein
LSQLQILGTNQNSTIINANSTDRVFYLYNSANTQLQGLKITGGYIGSGDPNYGGGILLDNCKSVNIASCTVEANRLKYADWDGKSYGGGLCVFANSSAVVSNCNFFRNKVGGSQSSRDYGGGAAIYGEADFHKCVFAFNRSYRDATQHDPTAYYFGAGLYTEGSVTLNNCLFHHNFTETATGSGQSKGTGIYQADGMANLNNCTIAHNITQGVYRAAGSLSISNSILWGNADDIVSLDTFDLGWSDIEDGDNNTTNGCISTDPLFASTNYYHLQSKRGNYINGYFSGGTWSQSQDNSPCIDAGNPQSDFSLEPSPNGHRRNMGVYGNTPKASMAKSAPMTIKCY